MADTDSPLVQSICQWFFQFLWFIHPLFIRPQFYPVLTIIKHHFPMISHSYVTYSKEICRLFHSALGYDAEKDVDDVDPAPWTIGDR